MRRAPARLEKVLTQRPVVVPVALSLLVFLVRLPFLHLPAFADEAGFLQVGANWHWGHGGTSLYGDYWVDRPPLLITLYGLASHLGGLTALRLLGGLAAAATVLGIARLCRALAPDRPERAQLWGAVAAAALFCTPYHWNFMVDGELLAAPFAAWGLLCVAEALRPGGAPAPWAWAAGALGSAAFLTKQNFLEVFVFAAALGALVVIRSRRAELRRVALVAAQLVGGAALVLAVGAGWTLGHGTRLGGVWYALFPFRLDAARDAGNSAVAIGRLAQLGDASLLSGFALLATAGIVAAIARGRSDPRVLAVLAVAAYEVFSVAGGTNYWLHYLVQPSIAVATLVGVLTPRAHVLRWCGLAAAAMSVGGVIWFSTLPVQTGEEVLGGAIGRSAQPGDQLVTFVGRSNVNLAAGLDSPYPYLWSLPARTLDPKYRKLQALLDSGNGPAWFVSFQPLRTGPKGFGLGAAVSQHYRRVSVVCRTTIYLRDDLTRATPTVGAPPPGTTHRSECQSAMWLPAPLG